MEFDEIVVKESPGLCRCCLSEGCYKDLGSEYTWMNETEVYADMLMECFDISITQHNDGPNGPNRLICEVCITRLRDACNFKKQVLDSEKKFIDMMARGDFTPKMLIYQAQMKSEDNILEMTLAEEVEYLDDDVDLGDDDAVKDESITEPTVSDITVSSLPVKGKRGRPRKNTVLKPEKKAKLAKLEEKPKTSKVVAKDEYLPGTYDGCTSERRRENLRILFNHTTVLPFKWRGKFICFYCGNSYTDYPDFKKHTKSHGNCSVKDYSLKKIKGNNIEIKIDVSEIVCEICNEPFSRYEEVIDHLIGKHNLNYNKSIDTTIQDYRLVDFKCLHCEQQFNYFGALISHVNNSHPRNSLICNDCGCSFNKKRDLACHIRNYHKEGGYPCDMCFQKFESKHSLRAHTNNTHFRRCSKCGLLFASLSLLQKHIEEDHPYPTEGNIKCSYCSREFHSDIGLKNHLAKCKVKSVAQVLIYEEPDPGENKVSLTNADLPQIRRNIQCILNMSTAVPFKYFSKYSCFYCSKKFMEFDELRQHTSLEHPVCDLNSKCMRKCKGRRIVIKIDISTLSCKTCCAPMQDLNGLIAHLNSDHDAKYDTTVKNCFECFKIIKDNIPCPICPDKVFRYFVNLQRHLNTEHSNNNRICDFCGRGFRSEINLRLHITYSHTGSCECEVCGMKLKNRACLQRHKAKNHDVKEYKCSKCPELFQSAYQKQIHMIKVHNIGHKCTYCDRMFARNSFMIDHVRRIHLKEKNVPCSVCNDRFFDNYLLRKHMAKHDGERKFKCSICDKAFLRKSNLSSHMYMHKKYGHVQPV